MCKKFNQRGIKLFARTTQLVNGSIELEHSQIQVHV